MVKASIAVLAFLFTVSVAAAAAAKEQKVSNHLDPVPKVYPHSGRLVSAHYELDEKTQTLATRAVFPNPEFLLRPGLKVTVQSRPQTEPAFFIASILIL